jgi:4-hydroxy-tetrahydrodipicolinate reductase
MKIALIGYGKMGRAIERVAKERGHEIELVVDEYNRATCTDAALKRAEVAIEFSTPTAAINNYEWCFRNGLPVVSGTTGWLSEWASVTEMCQRWGGGFFYASNFSLGVNLFFHLNRWLAKVMAQVEGYNVSIEEIHHVHKLDAPSGTAIALARDVIESTPRYASWKVTGTTPVAEDEVPITAKREGEVPGIHAVDYVSAVDEIRIYHSARSRDGFALGAVIAAEFMLHKRGIYGMNDLITIGNERYEEDNNKSMV